MGATGRSFFPAAACNYIGDALQISQGRDQGFTVVRRRSADFQKFSSWVKMCFQLLPHWRDFFWTKHILLCRPSQLRQGTQWAVATARRAKPFTKLTNSGQNCAKTCLSSSIKRLHCLNTGQKPTFQPMEVCCKWACLQVSWVDPVCFYALLCGSGWFCGLVSGVWTVFGPFLLPFVGIWFFFGLPLASVVSLGASCAAGPPPCVQSKRSHRPSQHHDVYSGINCFWVLFSSFWPFWSFFGAHFPFQVIWVGRFSVIFCVHLCYFGGRFGILFGSPPTVSIHF